VLVLWAVTAAVTVIAGRGYGARFSVTASLFMAVAAVAATAMFMAVGALCAQLAGTRRQAAAIAAAVFGAAYLIRLIAYTSTSLMWLHWASPLGWVDELRPLTGSRPLVLLPIAGFTAVLAVVTILLAGRRDLGASMLPASDTAAARTRLLTGPFGLACRLARRGALGWLAGLAGGGLILGLTAKGTETVFSSQSGGVIAKLGGASGGAAYLGLGFLIMSLVAALAAAGLVSATREEESEGYLDNLLARPVVRLPWLAGRFAVSVAVLAAVGVAAGLFTSIGAAATGAGLSFATLLAAGVNIIPAGVFVLGIGTLIYGLAPRYAVAAAYGIVAWSFLVEIIGAGIGASRWLLDTSVLHHIARAPATGVRWDSAAILVAIGIAAAVAGALAFRHRDLAGA
jgi:ABC-2 type transport system permease protein